MGELLDMGLLLFLESMADTLELEDMLPTPVELFTLQSVKLKLNLDIFMADMEHTTLVPVLELLAMLPLLFPESMEVMLELDDMSPILVGLFTLQSAMLKLSLDISMRIWDMAMAMAMHDLVLDMVT